MTPTEAEISAATKWLHRYMAAFGPWGPAPYPPERPVVKRFLAIAPWPALRQLLAELGHARTPAGQTYTWFIGAARARLH